MVDSISAISGFVTTGSVTPLEIVFRTSSPLILPRGPVPLISLRDSPLFDAILRAAGVARWRRTYVCHGVVRVCALYAKKADQLFLAFIY